MSVISLKKITYMAVVLTPWRLVLLFLEYEIVIKFKDIDCGKLQKSNTGIPDWQIA